MAVASAPDYIKQRGAIEPDEEGLVKIRKKMAEARVLELELATMVYLVSEKQAKLAEIRTKDLPDLFKQYRVKDLTLNAEGNYPAYEAHLVTSYRASISAEWDEDKRRDGIEFVSKTWKCPDLVKHTYTVKFGMKEHKEAKKLAALLRKNKIEYGSETTIPWNSLTAELRRRCEAGDVPSSADLAKIGGYVGEVVNMKLVKKDK